MTGPNYTLYYFDFRGRGELLRLLLHVAQVDFIDNRVQASQWPQLKPKTPEGYVPFMEIDGVQYGESLPLARHIARKYNLMGETELDQLTADIILNYVDELRHKYVRFKMDPVLTAEQKLTLQEKFQNEAVPNFLNKIEKRLIESSSDYLAGKKLSIADLSVADVLDTFLYEDPGVLDCCPHLSAHKARIMRLPQLTSYLSNRPDTKL